MEEKLYNLMDWAGIEAIVYSEEDNPHGILGPHITEEGVLIQTFLPGAVKVSVKVGKEEYPMVQEDEEGFYAVLIPGDVIPVYTKKAEFDSGDVIDGISDPYAFEPQISENETRKFNAGICYDIYEKLGAHPMKINGVDGVLFAVWAPNAIRVSVVCDAVLWDGRRLPMRRLWDSGIFELFVPGLTEGTIYKYEIKAKGGLTFLKADPYANAAELRPNNASVVADLTKFKWSDQSYLKNRKKQKKNMNAPMFIYEMHLGSWRKPEDEERLFYNYREIAPMLADYVKEMGYTHVELMPIMEHPFDGSWGYQVTGYYAPTSRYGSPEDFMYFMNYMHEQGIGVILDWVPAHFPRDTFGLCTFDGTCLYEHFDPRQGWHPDWGTLIYNYGRPEVRNFLIANALFWAEKYHVDGIRMDAVASMLYLDYGKKDGEWVANMYGGNENLEAIEFFKHLNSIFAKKYPDTMLIAEESTAWPKITGDVEEDGLGFDYKWNMGWMNDYINYMSLDPLFRGGAHGSLTFSMIYAYSENFILTLSHDEVVHGKASMIGKMPGDREQKFANLRAAYGYMMCHPGKKLLFMGQDFAQFHEWSEERSLEWELLQYEDHRQMHEYMKALNLFYKEHPALYELDYDPEGFTWINAISANENMLIFTRNTKKKEEMLLVVCNFSPLVYENHKIGVPYPGKYKEIFNSDRKEFGGSGAVNPRLKQSKKEECDDREDSITIKVPPMGIAIFSYTKSEPKARTNKEAKKDTKKASVRKKDLKTELEEKYVQSRTEVLTAYDEHPEPAKTEVKAAEPTKKTEATKASKPTKAAEPVKKKEATKASKPAKAAELSDKAETTKTPKPAKRAGRKKKSEQE